MLLLFMSVLPAQDSVLCFQADHGVPISVRSLVRQVTVQVADQVAAVEDGGEDGTTEQRNPLSLGQHCHYCRCDHIPFSCYY